MVLLQDLLLPAQVVVQDYLLLQVVQHLLTYRVRHLDFIGECFMSCFELINKHLVQREIILIEDELALRWVVLVLLFYYIINTDIWDLRSWN